MVVDEYKGEEVLTYPKRKRSQEFKFLINGRAEIDLNYVYELFSTSRLKIPPVSLPYFDPAIIGGILAIEKLYNQKNLRLDQHLREQVGVISASNYFLQRFVECHQKTCWLEAWRRLDPETQTEQEWIKESLEKYLPISEDTFPGALNNLIAGKATKDFDFKGVNFNVAAEKLSLPVAIDYAKSLLQYSSGALSS